MRIWVSAGIAMVGSVAFVGALLLLGSREALVTVVSDLGQLVAAALACVGCALASRRQSGRQRRAWAWVATGTGCWGIGQTVWTWYEVGRGQEVPFPSFADLGFLAFPIVAGVGLVIWSGTQIDEVIARGRDLMDGAIFAVSLLVLSWVIVMDAVVQASGGFGFSTALSLAYPVGDVVLATLVTMALVRSDTQRPTLALLGIGLWVFALADSAFSYLTSNGTFSNTDLVSNGGWVCGLLLVAASGMSAPRADVPTATPRRRLEDTRSMLVWQVLPYAPLLAVGVALFVNLLTTNGSRLLDLLLAVVVVMMVLGRQFLAMADNHRLVIALVEAGDQLEHLATHDALTGLPNRTLFAKRLDRALLEGPSQVSVLFCDLDNFKPVNDELGHAAGDELLKVVAGRLLGCVRSTDTVARLGGDEFAIVLQRCTEPREVAHRVVEAMDRETIIQGRPVRTTISVGLAHHPGLPRVRRPDPEQQPVPRERRAQVRVDADATSAVGPARDATAARLVQLADAAMYAAKTAGKGQVAVIELELEPVG